MSFNTKTSQQKPNKNNDIKEENKNIEKAQNIMSSNLHNPYKKTVLSTP